MCIRSKNKKCDRKSCELFVKFILDKKIEKPLENGIFLCYNWL